MSAIKPTQQTELIVDEFIKYATQHLTTVSGLINTISMYPPAPTPGPGIIPWSGYFIPPSVPTPPLPDNVQEIDMSANIATPEQQQIGESESLKGRSINESTAAAFGDADVDTNEEPLPWASEYSTVREHAKNAPMPELSENILPINGIQEIPNYQSKLKVPAELILAMRKYGVGKTPLERAHFLAQVAHESMNFFYKEEIASGRNYEGSKKLGNSQPGDGMRFKGRGYIQLTGRYNYQLFSRIMGVDIVSNPLLVSQKYHSDVSCIFWKINNIGREARGSDIESIRSVTHLINGKENGFPDRVAKFRKFWAELQKNPNLWK